MDEVQAAETREQKWTRAGEAVLRAALGPVQEMLDRPGVTEVCCNEPFMLDVEERGVWRRVPAPDFGPDRIARIARTAAHLTGQDVGRRNPICYTVLPNDERLTIALQPVVAEGKACLDVRRRPKRALSFDAICDAGMFDEAENAGDRISAADAELLDLHLRAESMPPGRERGDLRRAFFKLAVQARKNIVLAGVPGSGKTTLMEALVALIPLDWRLLTIENTPEIDLPHLNKVQCYYSKGGLSEAAVTADDLAELVLRLYPTLTLFGELQDKSALAYMRVVAAGNPGLTTLHAMSVKHIFQVLALQMRQHPSAATIEMPVLDAWIRDVVDVAAHFERLKERQPDGSVRERFRCTEVYFKPAGDLGGRGQEVAA